MLDLQRLKERKEALLKSNSFSTLNQSISVHSSHFNFAQPPGQAIMTSQSLQNLPQLSILNSNRFQPVNFVIAEPSTKSNMTQ